jgi:GAF domain-containing protein
MEYNECAEFLDKTDAELARARTLEGVQHVVRTAARRLVNADGATFVLLEGEHCYYADEDSMSPLWKGQRFPVTACISGWSMMHKQVVVIADIRADDRIPQAAYRPTFVRSLVMTPMLIPEPLGAIGAYWARLHHASTGEIAVLRRLADITATAVRRFPYGVPDPGFVF